MQPGCKSTASGSPYELVSANRHSASGLTRDSVSPDPLPKVERAVAWLSMACAVHCLLVPVAAALLPVIGASATGALGSNADRVLSLLVVSGGAASALFGFRRHRDLRLSLAMGACILVYLAGHGLEDAWYGHALAILGGVSLALTSFASARLGHVHSESCTH